MEDEGQAETKWSPINNDTKPLLKHVRPIRANYVPRKYRPFEDGDTSSDVCACSNTNSSITLESISETPRNSGDETKPGQSEENFLINKSPLKGKDVAASIQINVEPVARLSPSRTTRKTIEDKHFPEVNASKRKGIRFNTNDNDSFTHIVDDVEKAKTFSEEMDDGELPKRPRGRPKGSTKRQRPKRQCNNRAVLLSRRSSKTKPLKSFKSQNPAPLSGSPRKRIKLTPSQGKKHTKENIEDQGPSSDAPTNEATANDNANTANQCNICNKNFSTQGRLENHMHWHVKRKMFKCRVCQRIFKGFGHFIRHQQLHSKAKVEKAVAKSSQSGANNNPKTTSRTKLEKTHKCNICSQTFTYLGRLKLHLATHTSPKKYRCHVCSKEFVNFGWLKHHAKKSHDLTHLTRRETRIRGSTSCVRKKVSNTLPEPQTHEEVANNFGKKSRAPKPIHVRHLDEQNTKSNCNSPDIVNRKTGEYQCGICNKVFVRQQTLVEHKRVHSGEMPFECHICNKRIMWRNQLHYHYKTVHGETRTYKCDECSALFKNSKLLREHKDTHCQAKPKSCLRSIPKSEDVQNNEENMHKCDKCDRTFRSLHGLHRHSASHRDPQPTTQTPSSRQSSRLRASRSPPKPQDPSPTCRKSSKYTTRSKIFSHASESNMHEEKAPQDKKEPIPEIEPDKQEWIKFTRENGQQVYRCGLCTNSDRKFTLVASVRKHVGMVHRDYTDNLVEPPGLYDDLPEETLSESKNSSSTSTPTSGGGNPTPQSSNLQKNCTCNGRGKAFVYKNNKLTHLPSNCPVHNKESSELKKTPKGTQILKCKHCEEEFDGLEREKFQDHEMSHELKATEPSGMAYACFECEVEFAMVNELMDHYETEH